MAPDGGPVPCSFLLHANSWLFLLALSLSLHAFLRGSSLTELLAHERKDPLPEAQKCLQDTKSLAHVADRRLGLENFFCQRINGFSVLSQVFNFWQGSRSNQ